MCFSVFQKFCKHHRFAEPCEFPPFLLEEMFYSGGTDAQQNPNTVLEGTVARVTA